MIARETTADRINAIANDPRILPLIAVEDQERTGLDLSHLLKDDRHYVLATGGIVFTFMYHEPCIYQLHTLSLPESRGRLLLRAAWEAAEFMFVRTDCMEILTLTPHDNPHASPPRHMGFQLDFTRERAVNRKGKWIGADFYALRYPDWVKHARGLEGEGTWFHNDLERKRKLAGQAFKPHPEEKEHYRRVGAAVKMIRNGQAAKGIVLYNRWARFAGYQPLGVAGITPLVLDLGDGLVRVENGEFEVLTCQ